METNGKEIKFIAYEPMLRPLPSTQGGGFRLSLDISEDQFESIKTLFNPNLKSSPLEVTIKSS
jgi:hypothetical protein